MAVEIRVRRGTKAQLDTVMAGGTPLVSGELGFTTDTKEVFVSDGTVAHLVGNVMVGLLTARPTAGVSGRMYHATDDVSTWVDNGSSWVDVSGGISNLDDIADGTTYGKVLNTYLNANRPDGIYTGTGKLTGATISGHINDATIHRSINDSGTSSTDLWSANKISLAIDQAISGLDFQDDVLDIQIDATLNPGSPVSGARYILTNTAALHAGFGTIVGVGNNDIVEYNGSAFVISYDVSVKGEGVLVWDRDSDTFQKYDGTSWSEFGGLSGITAGDGLTKTGNTINVIGGDGLSVTADAIAVNPTAFTGTGLEVSGGDIRIAAAAAGNGLTGGAGSALAVGAGDGIDVAADAISVDVTDILGTGLSEDASNNIRIGTQGNGITGGNGTTLSILANSTTGATVAPVNVSSNGVGVTVDNISIIHTAGTLSVSKVDGGSF